MRHFVIVTPEFNPNIGGVVALHQLAHELRLLGEAVQLWPLGFRFDPDSPRAHLRAALRHRKELGSLRRVLPRPLGRAHAWHPPAGFDVSYGFPGELGTRDERIVIYPEIVDGNPLQAKHRVRWLLHEPGYFFSHIDVDTADYFVRYSDSFNQFRFYGMKLRERNLTVSRAPDCYLNPPEEAKVREGLVYSVRKGHENFQPELVEGGICLDDLEHPEVAAHFRRAKRFVSFDTRSFLTQLAVLCGIEVVVVPEPGVTSEQWVADKVQREGIAWGFDEDELRFARETAPLRRKRLLERIARQSEEVSAFVVDCREVFDL